MSSPDASDPYPPSFSAMGLSNPLLKALADAGYTTPSPIQAATVPPLLAGRDLLGQAQTGTGKTAAFALPILSRRADDAEPGNAPRALVLAPTRELAMQVAEAFERYAAYIPGFRVLAIYGGQGYGPQLTALKRGVDVVVGTPGRVIDHLKRGTLRLDALEWLVLDEADEMLRMGFIDDVEWIFENTPAGRQVALFSATMPTAIRQIARTHLRDPQEVTIRARTSTAENIRQRYWIVGGGLGKFAALTRLLDAEPVDAAIVFARTKKATDELAEQLAAHGLACAALNGDIVQAQRERTIAQLKNRQLDVIVATDVAARGLDVERISHVINFDIPHDSESYVHRIGRTGRAGRRGDAILFVTRREKHRFQAIERATRQPIEPMDIPTWAEVTARRLTRFKQRISDTLAGDDLAPYIDLITDYCAEHDVDAVQVAAALARLGQADPPSARQATQPATEAATAAVGQTATPKHANPTSTTLGQPATGDAGRDTVSCAYRIEIGRVHGVEPRNIVGAIANETSLARSDIGRITIRRAFSLLELPGVLSDAVWAELNTVRIGDRPLAIAPAETTTAASGGRRAGPGHKPRHKKTARKKDKKKATRAKPRAGGAGTR